MFNEPLSKTAEWYQNNKRGDIKDYVKVIFLNNKIISFVILNLCKLEDGTLQLGINPIVVNPKLFFHGYRTEIIKELINNHEEIVSHKIDTLYAEIDNKNLIIKKSFVSAGFIKKGSSEGQNFDCYYLKV